jgi:predicted small secreted protein
MNSSRWTFIAVALAALSVTSCNVVKEIGQSITNLSRCSFKLDGISDFRLAGVSLQGKTALNFSDATQAVASFSQGELPASFILNIAVHNPNTGTGGTPKSTVTLTSLAWRLLIDDVQTIEGEIPQSITIPGTGQQSIIPIPMKLDLVKFFRDKGYDKIVNLAFALGGAQGSASRVTLRAKPTVKTDFGPLTYPGEIDIVDKEFRGQ